MNQEIYTPSLVKKRYFDGLSSPYDKEPIQIEGIYINKRGNEYRGYFYDRIFEGGDKNNSLTLKIKAEEKENFIDGRSYIFRGFINRTNPREESSDIGLHVFVIDAKVPKEQKALFSEKHFYLLSDKVRNGYTKIDELILNTLSQNGTPSVLIITGKESIVDEDFKNQFKKKKLVCDITWERVVLREQTIIEYIKGRDFEPYDFLVFMRGGGEGMGVFDNKDVCVAVFGNTKTVLYSHRA